MTKLRIKELREDEKLTQAQLAKVIGVNWRTIGHYENGRLEPSLETIEKLCKFFEVSAGYLLGMEDY